MVLEILEAWGYTLESDLEFMPSTMFQQLFDYYLPGMPYGTAKARTGDPYQYVLDKINFLKSLDKQSVLC